MTLELARQTFLKRYNEFALDLASLFVQELEDQGHRATGKLIASVVAKVSGMLNDLELQLTHLDYGIIVNTGLLPAQVPYTRGSGAKSSKFIEALMGWIRLKGIGGGLDKTVRGIAFAIATNMKKEGVPTQGSYRFTSNGRRTMWIDYIYNRYNVQWQDDIEILAGDFIENAFDASLEKVATQYAPFIEFSKN